MFIYLYNWLTNNQYCMAKKGIDILNRLESIEIKKPSDIVLEKIRGLILDGILEPGDQLPTERDFAAKFNVGRSQVREAIKKLEFYGIVKTFPQSGTVVSSQGIPLLENMISNIIKLDKDDKMSLMEIRDILEVNAAGLTAERITTDQLSALETTLMKHHQAIQNGSSGISEDLVFHLKIAEFSGNPLLHSMIMLITPEVHHLSGEKDSCKNGRAYDAWLEHKNIFEALAINDSAKSKKMMEYHLQNARISYA